MSDRLHADQRWLAARRDLGSAALDWSLRNAWAAESRSEFERAARWAKTAAQVARHFPFLVLTSAGLESLLTRIGTRGLGSRRPSTRRGEARAWLHVLTASNSLSGHTSLVRRWIGSDRSGARHDVLLTDQPARLAESGLACAVERSGGTVTSSASEEALLARASRLREVADGADVVVLHTHAMDVVPSLAFAVSGGPPVVLINHDDHAFWVGTAVADLVVDIRTSGGALSETFRGVRRHAELPIPLDDRGPAPRSRAEALARRRVKPLDSELLLVTVGGHTKYAATSRLDFLRAVGDVLRALPHVGLVAIGPRPNDPAWERLTHDTDGRAVALGPDSSLRPWHAAADLYVEGFPVGSYTALLEAGLSNRALVRKPYLVSRDVLPADEGALRVCNPPEDTADYTRRVIELCENGRSRDRLADAAREAVVNQHCGDPWRAHLAALVARIPAEHVVNLSGTTPPMPPELSQYWSEYSAASEQDNPAGFAYRAALANGLAPRLDLRFGRALATARGAGTTAPSPVKALAGSWALSTLPRSWAERLYRTL